MKKIITLLSFIILGYSAFTYINSESNLRPQYNEQTSTYKDSNNNQNSDYILKKAFENQTSNLQVEGRGIVIKILPDDLEGSRHQKFILKLISGQTLLVAHNIDIAPRINNLNIGDEVSFFGEYEYNSKGGVIHWTHHDPDSKHINGWLKHNNKIYQ